VSIKRFNLRVYAIITNEKGQYLLADEEYFGERFTKFPGGGVELGEGVLPALQREAIEELGQQLKQVDHFYTTDFYQESAFREGDQIISIYYTAKLTDEENLYIGQQPFDFSHGKPGFRWVDKTSLKDELKFPIDLVVLGML